MLNAERLMQNTTSHFECSPFYIKLEHSGAGVRLYAFGVKLYLYKFTNEPHYKNRYLYLF
ncbi:hypothetical protein A4D02_09975 [Niastella koreensis]|uniref:Uncharacterized protein n=1 Tax=Niastella koreensis TaxID=354356 RepID=A0ABX3NRF4_9BACT|nr:hypothetical protein A4D02_09975 [Niastella koreensis]